MRHVGKRYICKQNPYWTKFSFTVFITFTSPKPYQVKYVIFFQACERGEILQILQSGARSIQPKFQPVRPRKVVHLKSGPVFSKLFRLDQTYPLSFGPKFPEILVEWIAPLICSESGWYFTILPPNPGGIVGSFIHKFVCCLCMSKNRHFQTIFLLKLTLLWALAGKSELYYSDKISDGRIKQVGEENL